MWSLPVRILAVGSLAVLTLAALACGGDKEPTAPTPAQAPADAPADAAQVEADRHSHSTCLLS